MPNAQDTEGDELHLEVIPEAESDVDRQTTSDGEGGDVETTVKLEEDDGPAAKKPTPNEESAKRQEESWLANVIAGKKKVEDAPKWLQPKISSRLETIGNAPKTEEIVKQAIAKERKSLEFKDLQKQIPPLTREQAKELTDRYNALKGADNVSALRTVLDAMGLSQKIKEAEARGVAKGKISLPRSGQPAVRKQESELVGGVPKDVIHDEQKWRKMIQSGNAE
jgi:hypothetical protein